MHTLGIISDAVTSCLLLAVCVLLFKVGRQMKRSTKLQNEIHEAISAYAARQLFVNAAEAFRIARLEHAVFGQVQPDPEPPAEAVH